MLTLITITNGICNSKRFRISEYDDALSAAISVIPTEYSYAEIRDRSGEIEFQSVNVEKFAEINRK